MLLAAAESLRTAEITELHRRAGKIQKVHVKRKRGVFRCSKCASVFGLRHNLLRHQRTIHEGRRPHKCPIDNCTAAFVQRFDLTAHMASVHGVNNLSTNIDHPTTNSNIPTEPQSSSSSLADSSSRPNPTAPDEQPHANVNANPDAHDDAHDDDDSNDDVHAHVNADADDDPNGVTHDPDDDVPLRPRMIQEPHQHVAATSKSLNSTSAPSASSPVSSPASSPVRRHPLEKRRRVQHVSHPSTISSSPVDTNSMLITMTTTTHNDHHHDHGHINNNNTRDCNT